MENEKFNAYRYTEEKPSYRESSEQPASENDPKESIVVVGDERR